MSNLVVILDSSSVSVKLSSKEYPKNSAITGFFTNSNLFIKFCLIVLLSVVYYSIITSNSETIYFFLLLYDYYSYLQLIKFYWDEYYILLTH